MTAPTPTLESSKSIPPSTTTKDDPAMMEEAPQRKGVFGWVKGKIQKRNVTAAMANINIDEVEKAAIADANQGEPSELDIAMGLGEGGVVVDDAEIPEEDRIDMEAENDEGLLVGWGKKLQEVEWVQKTRQVVEERVADAKEQQELREIHEKYKKEIKEDPDIKALQKKIKKITKNLKVQRLNGDRIDKRNTFYRDKEQKELDQKVSRLRKAIWTFSNSSMNSHEYAKAMMRASARLQRKGIKVHKSEKALAMEAAVLRNMHRMLAIQKQYTMSKRACNDVSGFMKRCKGWLDNKLADGEMGIMVLEATSKSMSIMYSEVIEVQEALKPKLEDPKNHTFKKERMKTILALPKGLRSMPAFLKGPKQPPMRISLRKKIDDGDPNLRGYRTFKEQNKAMEIAWKQELKQYENQLLVGGSDFKEIKEDEVSDLGDSEDEIEANLAAVSMGAAAAKKASQIDVEKMAEDQKNVTFKDGETKEGEGEADKDEKKEEGGETKDDKAAVAEDKDKAADEEKPTEGEAKPAEEAKKPAEGGEDKPATEVEEKKPEDKAAEEEEEEEKPTDKEEKAMPDDDDDTAGETLATGGGDIHAAAVEKPTEAEAEEKPTVEDEAPVDQSERSAESATVPEETPQEQQQADAAALQEVQKSGGDEDPDVDEAALPEEVKQEDLDNLLNKEADDAAQDTSDHADNTVEEALAGVVEDTLAAVGDEEGGGSASDDEDEAAAPTNTDNRSVVSAASTEISV